MRDFVDRADAGLRLAERVAPLVAGEDAVVLALPRGGVPVARQVAARIGAPLDVLLVRKLGVPWQPELAFGAVSTGGALVLNEDLVEEIALEPDAMQRVVDMERTELQRRERLYRGPRPPIEVEDKTVVIVDDGIATGSTVRAALRALEARGAARTIVAAPVAARETVESLRLDADRVECLLTPDDLLAIGYWYQDFSPVRDSEVLRLLEVDLTRDDA